MWGGHFLFLHGWEAQQGVQGTGGGIVLSSDGGRTWIGPVPHFHNYIWFKEARPIVLNYIKDKTGEVAIFGNRQVKLKLGHPYINLGNV